jgi:hypothetical protein
MRLLLHAQIAQDHFLKRLGSTRDVANAALFLASSESAWVTGRFSARLPPPGPPRPLLVVTERMQAKISSSMEGSLLTEGNRVHMAFIELNTADQSELSRLVAVHEARPYRHMCRHKDYGACT